MQSVELVIRHYSRLKSEFDVEVERGSEKRSRPFYEWATGRVLLDAEATKKTRESVTFNAADGTLIRHVYYAFMETGEARLIPALTFDKNKQPIVIVVIQP